MWGGAGGGAGVEGAGAGGQEGRGIDFAWT